MKKKRETSVGVLTALPSDMPHHAAQFDLQLSNSDLPATSGHLPTATPTEDDLTPVFDSFTVIGRQSKPKQTGAYDTYWRFAFERQEIFFRRLCGQEPPWTKDPILSRYKFTNAYRASDRTSQYLIKRVIYTGAPDEEEVFFRTILFKLFNRIETWELLCDTVGVPSFREFSFQRYDAVLTRAMDAGKRIYSAAYIMPAGGRSPSGDNRKHRHHLMLLERMMHERLPSRLANVGSMAKGFRLLRHYPSIGDFLAYQLVTDFNYSEVTDFSENEFVMPGPGARDGIRKCFKSLGGFSEADVIRFMRDNQEAEFDRLGLRFQTLWGRPLQLIDCQSLFCEVDKYSRVKHPELAGLSGRTRIKQQFASRGDALPVWYPPKWGLNDKIKTLPHSGVYCSSTFPRPEFDGFDAIGQSTI